MSSENSPKFIQGIFNSFDAALNDYLLDGVNTLMSAISPVAKTCFAIYILMWGYMHLTNKIEQPVTEMTNAVIKAALILTFALNVSLYTEYVVDFVSNVPPALASLFAGETSSSIDGYTSTGVVLDELIAKGFKTGNAAWQKGSIFKGDVGMYLVGAVFYAATGLLVGTAAVLVLTAKIATTVLLVLGPIFILLLFFGSTKNLFNQWLISLVNYILMYVITILLASLIFDMVSGFFDKIDATKGPAAATQIAMASIFGTIALLQSSSLASSLSGGMGLTTAGGGMLATRLATGGLGRFARGGKTTQNLRDMKANQRAKNIMDAGGRRKHAVQSTKAAGARVANMYRRKNSISR